MTNRASYRKTNIWTYSGRVGLCLNSTIRRHWASLIEWALQTDFCPNPSFETNQPCDLGESYLTLLCLNFLTSRILIIGTFWWLNNISHVKMLGTFHLCFFLTLLWFTGQILLLPKFICLASILFRDRNVLGKLQSLSNIHIFVYTISNSLFSLLLYLTRIISLEK